MSQPPPIRDGSQNRNAHAWKIILAIFSSGVVLVAIGIFAIVHYLGTSGITRPLDNMFGDQFFKTTVALIELHKVRYGKYPQSLRELRFTGDWDQGALVRIRYYPAPDGSKYCIEIVQGWLGKPTLEYPPEFWQGTGYSPNLCPHSQ
jgi:hypothetical protein